LERLVKRMTNLVFEGKRWIAGLLLSVAALCNLHVQAQEIQLLGVGRLPGKMQDRSALDEALEDGTPHNQFGGISGLEQVGDSDEYLALPDRGPKDGAVDFQTRFHRLKIKVDPQQNPAVAVELLGTTLLKDESGRPLVGRSAAFGGPGQLQRFDPEGIRASGGNVFITDEYGPFMFQFASDGKLQKRFQLSPYLSVAKLAPDKKETDLNDVGRQSNGGMEGLAYDSASGTLVGLMQRPLLQDSVRDEKKKPVGKLCRIVLQSTASDEQRELVYVLENPDYKLSEILAAGDNRFLVIERDGESGNDIGYQRIMEIDLTGATDVKGQVALDKDAIGKSIVPVKKKTLIDLLDAKYGLKGATMPEKIEGLAWGPKLADGRRTLIVAVDNDFVTENDSLFYVFAW
jgi:hypothetical protein